MRTNTYAAFKRVTTPCDKLTYEIIGAAMRVHTALGPGLKEAIYHRALGLELEKAGLTHLDEKPVEIHLDEDTVGLLFIDHLVEDRVIVEDKALSHMLTNEELAQLITYLAATGLEVGLLLNFGRTRLEYRRVFPPTNRAGWMPRIRRYLWHAKP